MDISFMELNSIKISHIITEQLVEAATHNKALKCTENNSLD